MYKLIYIIVFELLAFSIESTNVIQQFILKEENYHIRNGFICINNLVVKSFDKNITTKFFTNLEIEELEFCKIVNMDAVLSTVTYNSKFNYIVVSYTTCNRLYSGNLITSRNNFLENLKNNKYTVSILSVD